MDVPARLKELDIHPSRSLGQNFLANDGIAEQIVSYASPGPGDVFLEVGPGLGILTSLLLDAGAKVVAVEKDTSVARGLEKVFAGRSGGLTVINGDILDQDLDSLEFNKVISNLPFQISSPFTFKLLKADFDLAVITYQLEFARRLTAAVGEKDYSRLTVMAYTRAAIEMKRKIKAGSFYPPPKVDAGVVLIEPRGEPPFELRDETFFQNMVRELFNHRRKKIRTSLKGARHILAGGMDRDDYKAAVQDIEHGDNRPEELSPQELGRLANELLDMINHTHD